MYYGCTIHAPKGNPSSATSKEPAQGRIQKAHRFTGTKIPPKEEVPMPGCSLKARKGTLSKPNYLLRALLCPGFYKYHHI